MEYEKYRNQLSFWFDQYGEDFLNFLSKYNIDLEEDKYSFLSVTTANRTVIIEYCDTIEKFEDFFNKLRAKNSSINFRYPPYQLKSIINDPKKTVPVSEEDFSPLDLFQEIKSLKSLLDSNFEVLKGLKTSLDNISNNVSFDINETQMEKLQNVLTAINNKLNAIAESTKENTTENEIIPTKKQTETKAEIRESIIIFLKKYGFGILSLILFLIIILRW